MEIGKAPTYALIAAAYIAEHSPTQPIQGREIATKCEMPFGYLLKILQILARRGILTSQVGRSGGFKLRHSAQAITVLQIVEAVEGPIVGKVVCHSACTLSKKAIATLELACKSGAAAARAELECIRLSDLLEPPAKPSDKPDAKVLIPA